jgi:trigger factor
VTSAVETLDATTVKITVTITEDELAPMIKHAYEHLGESINVPGFRKGKVPAKVLEQRIGRGAAIEHAVNHGIAEWYGSAVDEHSLKPLGQPEIDVTRIPGQVPGDEGLEFTATVDVRPAITLPKIESVTLTVAEAAVEESVIDARLDSLRARFATLTGVDRPAANDDFVTLDLSATLDGAEVDAVQGTSYQVGSGSMLEGLDDVIVGLSAGEETSYEGPLAAGDHAGEKALIRIKVTAVKERELPAADDAFAQLASEFDTLAELREDLRGQAGKILLNNQAVEARAALVDHLKEAVSFEVPARTIEHEVHTHLEGEGRLEDDEHRAEVTKEAGEALRTQIILDQLVDDLDVSVEEYEILDYLVNMSRQYGMDPEEFIKQMQRANRIPAVVADVVRSKATAFALRRVKVKDAKGKVVDLTDVIGTPEADAKRAEAFAASRSSAKSD